MKQLKHIFLFLVVFTTTQAVFAQFEIPEKPEFQTSVYDYINMFSSLEKNRLEQKLIKYSDTTSTQIVVITIASTKGENISYLGANWGEEWGIGQEKEDNGILILLARDDRKIAINSGKGVEHLVTDAMSKRIIERDIIPFFKRGDYIGGLNKGADSIFEVMTGEYQGTRQSNSTDFPIGIFLFIFFVFIVFLIAISASRRGGGNNKGNGNKNRDDSKSILEAIIFSNSGRGSYRRSSGGFGGFGGGSSSSSGGFGGGFGGGSFGGGGASGSW